MCRQITARSRVAGVEIFDELVVGVKVYSLAVWHSNYSAA